MSGKYRALAVAALCAVLCSGGIVLAETLSGWVYAGDKEVYPPASSGLQGVLLTLYGSNNQGQLGPANHQQQHRLRWCV